MADETTPQSNAFRRAAFYAGPIVAAGMLLFADLEPGNPLVTRTAAVALWMAVWWLTGAAPMGTTALLPLVLFPLLGIMGAEQTAGYYINDSIFLFLGGFLIALAMQRWDLHRRIALRLLMLFGVKPRRLLTGFMLPTFFLSMWISNTATTMMMVPIALSLIAQLEQDVKHPEFRKYTVGLLCGIAFASSIGGTATLIGTVPNIVFVSVYGQIFPDAPEINFAQWFLFAFPLAFFMGGVLWAMLAVFYCPRGVGFGLNPAIIRDEFSKLGPMRQEEKVVAFFFGLVALLWLTRSSITINEFTLHGWASFFPYSDYFRDGTVGITVAILLFLIPSRNNPGTFIMDWETAKGLPWDILLLIGGGFALAGAFGTSGLSIWIGNFFKGAEGMSPLLLLLLLCATTSILTEFTSNTATCQILLPILAAVALALGINPLFLMIPATLACSYAFILPVATPPNAIVFGTRRITVAEMAKAGFAFNILAVLALAVAMFTLGDWVFGIDLSKMPDWAVHSGGGVE